VDWAINLFRNLQVNIFIYYFITVATFLGVLHYILVFSDIENIFLIAVIMLSFVSLSAFFISKLAIDPLKDHIQNLQNLSKETLHELNLPISTIKTNIQMIKKDLKDEKSLKRLKRIESGCDMLEQRYNELDYLIKTQSVQDIKERFDLESLVYQRVEFVKQIYPNTKFRLELESTHILNDKLGLSKVIDNIIDNGVKYSQNSNKIDIKLKNHELSIKDYGCGMEEFELLRIFDNYYQSDKSVKGFGIGLSMIKRFCDKQNIYLNFDSKVDIGTTVTLKFKKDKDKN
jgi:signal transduction histidine kinase